MNLDQLSNYQLYEIIQNQKLDKHLRTAANDEFNLRKLRIEEVQEIINKHDSLFQTDKSAPLSFKYKILALTIPFFWIIHILMTSRYLARGQKRKWNEYWLFFCIGLIILDNRGYYHWKVHGEERLTQQTTATIRLLLTRKVNISPFCL